MLGVKTAPRRSVKPNRVRKVNTLRAYEGGGRFEFPHVWKAHPGKSPKGGHPTFEKYAVQMAESARPDRSDGVTGKVLLVGWRGKLG